MCNFRGNLCSLACVEVLLARLCKGMPSLVQDCIPGLVFGGGDSWAAAVCPLSFTCIIPETSVTADRSKAGTGQPGLSKGDATAVVRRAGVSPGVCRESNEYSCAHRWHSAQCYDCPILSPAAIGVGTGQT